MAKIGTLIIEIKGNIFRPRSIDFLQAQMYGPLNSISEKVSFDYKRFGYFSASLRWVLTLKEFWKNDLIYKILKNILNAEFRTWEMNLTLFIEEKGE